MYFVVAGFFISLIAVLLRAIRYPSRQIKLDVKYYGLLAFSMFGSFVAYLGFNQLSQVPINENIDYSQILTVLSLLAAAIITGYFTFSFGEAAEDEKFLTTAISICFMALFYSVFGAICFYMGKSKQIHNSEEAITLVPLIMLMLLFANVLYDFWDYREGN